VVDQVGRDVREQDEARREARVATTRPQVHRRYDRGNATGGGADRPKPRVTASVVA
jgi:hypothetical protein